MWGHNYHFHIRMRCPAENPDCKPQEPPGHSEGCGHDLDWWFTDAVLHPKPSATPAPPRPSLKMADLPAACRQVLLAP
jgi:penicillin-insensitive murein endopeptidase